MGSGYSIIGRPAPELRVPVWLDPADSKVRIADIEEPVIYLFAFQSWCPGCHLHGFPTLKTVGRKLRAAGMADMVKFVIVQTAFEGLGTNTAEKAQESLSQHGLDGIALGTTPAACPP